MGRVLIITLTSVIALAACVLSMPQSDGEESEWFTEGPYTYSVLEEGVVSLSFYDHSEGSTDLVLPDTVIHEGTEYSVLILNAFFYGDTIQTITIPASIHTISYGGTQFSPSSLTAIYVEEGNYSYVSEGGVLYDYDMHSILRYPASKEGDLFVVPASVSTISAEAFANSGIKDIIMPNSIIQIQSDAFMECRQLRSINQFGDSNFLPDSVIIVESYAFCGCTELKFLQLPDSLRIIGMSAFQGSGLLRINIPWAVTDIGDGAFADCLSLTAIESDSYDDGAFFAEDGVLYKGGNFPTLVAYPADKKESEFEIPKKVVDIRPFSFAGCMNLKKIVIPDALNVIPENAFYGCTSLEEINLKNVSVIEYWAFENCVYLKNLEFGDGLTSIGAMAFSCTGVEELVFPTSLRSVNPQAFFSCTELRSITIPEGSKVTLLFEAFRDCISLEDIFIDGEGTVLEEGCFNISDTDEVTVKVTVPKGYSVPDNAVSETFVGVTHLDITVEGERPYPYENIVGVIICAVILILVMRSIGGV